MEKSRSTEEDIFIAAAEFFLRAIGYDDEKEYDISALLYHLKTEVDSLYPLLEFDTESAFMKVKDFIKNYVNKVKTADSKKYDEDRLLLIYTSFMRALQRVRL